MKSCGGKPARWCRPRPLSHLDQAPQVPNNALRLPSDNFRAGREMSKSCPDLRLCGKSSHSKPRGPSSQKIDKSSPTESVDLSLLPIPVRTAAAGETLLAARSWQP